MSMRTHHNHKKRPSLHTGRRASGNHLLVPRPRRPRISSLQVLAAWGWRALRHPLLPLLLIVGLIAAAIFLSDKPERQNNNSSTETWTPDKDFDDAQHTLTALRLIDAHRNVEAADMLQNLSQPPMRLSALMAGVRNGAEESRHELFDLLNTWLLGFCAAGAPPFPTGKTPLATIALISDIATFYSTHPERRAPARETATIDALFKRIDIELKLRQIDSPTQAQGLQYD